MEDLLRSCGSCGAPLESPAATVSVERHRASAGEPIGLLEDGMALCPSCAMDADRDYELPSLEPAA